MSSSNNTKQPQHDLKQFVLASDDTAREWISHDANAFPTAIAKQKNYATRVNSARRRLHEQMLQTAGSKDARKDMKHRLNQDREIRRRKDEYWKAISSRTDGRAKALQGVIREEHDGLSPRGRPQDTKFLPSGASVVGGVNLLRRNNANNDVSGLQPRPPMSSRQHGRHGLGKEESDDVLLGEALEQYVPHTLEAAQSSERPRQRRTATEFITTLNEDTNHSAGGAQHRKDINLVVHEHLVRLRKAREELDCRLPLDPSVSLGALEAVIEAKQSGQQVEHGGELEALLVESHAQLCAALYYLPPSNSNNVNRNNATKSTTEVLAASNDPSSSSSSGIPRPLVRVQPQQAFQCVDLFGATPYRTLCHLLDERCKDAEEQAEVLQVQVHRFEAAVQLPHSIGNTLPLDQALLAENKGLKLEVRSLKQRLRDSKRETLYYQRQANELQGSVKGLFERLHELTVQQRTSADGGGGGGKDAAASAGNAVRRNLHDVLKESYEDLVHVLPVEYAPQEGIHRLESRAFL